MASRSANLYYFNKATAHRFSRDAPDPDMLYLCDLIVKSGRTIPEIVEAVLKESNNGVRLSKSTIHNWLSGKTRHPHNFTVTWVGIALGVRKEWVQIT